MKKNSNQNNNNPDLSQYTVSAGDWRTAVKQNQTRTFIVVLIFFLIYASVGFLIDLYLYSAELNPNPQTSISAADLNTTAKRLVTLQLFPLATLIMFLIAFFSLLIAFYFHDRLVMMGTDYHEVTSESKDTVDRQLYNVIEELRIASGLRFMPKIYIIEADYMNAFASGLSEKSAMVAITRGLIEKLNRAELQAVMAHELSHIRHNDIRLTLMVLVLSNIMLIAVDILFRGILYSRSRRENGLVFIILIVRFLLPILTVLLMLYLSRKRELMADAGSVELTRSNEPLASALLKIDGDHKENYDKYNEAYSSTPHEEIRRAAYLYDPSYADIKSFFSLNSLFSSHPSLEERLKALGIVKKKS